MVILNALILLVSVNSLGKYAQIGVHKTGIALEAYVIVCQATMGLIVPKQAALLARFMMRPLQHVYQVVRHAHT